MNIPVTIHQARLGQAEFKVIRPARPPARAVLVDRDRYLNVSLDRHAARLTAGLWSMAASSPRSLIHLPIRNNPLPEADPPRPGERRLDLVLLHHSLQFPPSRWKELRARLGPGRPQTVAPPVPAPFPEDGVAGWEVRHHAENRDLFHQHVHADTLFMTGSAKLFRETARHFFDIALYGPGHVSRPGGYPHYCTELHSLAGILGNAREFHIEYRGQWGAEEPAAPDTH
ncbi:hypothetical protein ACFXDJ_33440 [Streptomyces sp. NPDC059443]|uniref:hypothetical protein n=1 Tax=unclassified Streptomyces TaxID=2593676 RepID=UPI003697B0F1